MVLQERIELDLSLSKEAGSECQLPNDDTWYKVTLILAGM